jgi:hypothetical protein
MMNAEEQRMGISIIQRRLPRASLLVAVVAALAALAATVMPLSAGGDVTSKTGSLRDLGRAFQTQTLYEFDTLAEHGEGLDEIAAASSVVGIGRIVDVREGYKVDLGPLMDGGRAYERHMLIVVEPQSLLKGADGLGSSGLVHISQPWSPAYPLDETRAAMHGAAEKVAFFLTPADLPSDGVVDEFAGREQDDAVFSPTQVSTVLGVDLQRKLAFPLLTDEMLERSDANVRMLSRAGAPVRGFTTIRLGVKPHQGSHPGEPESSEQ